MHELLTVIIIDYYWYICHTVYRMWSHWRIQMS